LYVMVIYIKTDVIKVCLTPYKGSFNIS